MAKGRKLIASRSERYLGSSSYSQGQGTASASSELGEDDVWSVIDGSVSGDDQAGSGEWGSSSPARSNESFGCYVSRRPIPRADHHHQVGGLSLAFDDCGSNTSSQRIVHQFRPESPRVRHVTASAPMDVPDWSKIYRVDSVESLPHWDESVNDSELVPPHEYLAREYAHSRRMAANSVFEGVGRTLKGRDLSRVRDAVWSRTGFDG